MNHKSKILVFVFSLLIVSYGISAAFYGKVVAKDDAYKELAVFMDVLKRINEDYVETPDMNKVQEGAMRGLIDALDPYCSFLTKDQYEALQKRTANGSAGVGIIISKRSDVIYVVSCERNGPATEAGIRPGDYLIAVDDRGVEDKSIPEVDSLLRGVPGSKVKVTVFRNSRTKPIDLEMVFRARAASPIGSRMLDTHVGLLEVSSLAGNALDQTKVRLKTLISAGAEKIILDLRNCADGEPAAGADLANFFLQNGTIYYSQNREGEKVRTIEASPDKHVTEVPAVVLINGSTAGAAEIAAGALKDNKRAAVVGEKSFGLGSEQRIMKLKSGAVLILSIAKYCTPGGKIIQDEVVRKTGIFPDIQSPDEEKRQDLAVESFYDNDQDDVGKYRQLQEEIDRMQLEKALEVLSGAQAPARKAA
jgi:carboxyl-terminal processing protease